MQQLQVETSAVHWRHQKHAYNFHKLEKCHIRLQEHYRLGQVICDASNLHKCIHQIRMATNKNSLSSAGVDLNQLERLASIPRKQIVAAQCTKLAF